MILAQQKTIDQIKNWIADYPFIEFALIVLGAILLYYITRIILIKGIRRIVGKTKTEIDDLLFNERILKKISLIVPLLFIVQFSHLIPGVGTFVRNLFEAVVALVVVLIINSAISAFNDIYEKFKGTTKQPIKGYLQVIKIIVFIFGTIVIIGILTDQEPWALFTGVGALTAVLMLIFKDTILSFIASIQISTYDLIRIEDWIEVPSLGVDGDVMDIALHTIRIRNFDKTITTIPTYKLIEVSFKNWRGMKETGGRRIKRAINIDQTSIKFCDDEMISRFRKYQLITDYMNRKLEEIKIYNEEHKFDTTQEINGRRLTNIGTFRAYLKEYLKQRKDVNSDLTFLIRHLEPGSEGLPVEIYIFASTTDWAAYEEIQADIFDHIFAVVPLFDLRIFQNPTGGDFKSLSK